MDFAEIPPFEIGPSQFNILKHDGEQVWHKLRAEATEMLSKEEILEHLLNKRILSHPSLGSATASLLASELACADVSMESWLSVLSPVFSETCLYDKKYGCTVQLIPYDLKTISERDPAAYGHASSFLYYKGFKAIQAHRAAHALWNNDRKFLALKVQSKCSELYGVDIHPNALIGPGLLLDHASGVVIGETASIGSNCIILHGVTLGGVGRHIADIVDKNCPMNSSMAGRRHPAVGSDVLIGCYAAILGPICVGDGAKIGSNSVVLKSVPARCTAVGSPARIIGRSQLHTESTQSQAVSVYTAVGAEPAPDENLYSIVYLRTWTLWADCIHIFNVIAENPDATISLERAVELWAAKVEVAPSEIPLHFLIKTFQATNVDPTTEEIGAKRLESAIISHIKEIEDSYQYNYQI